MIPIIIKRCLAYGIQIYPYQLETILAKYELYKIPDDILNKLKADQLKPYLQGLYLSGQEMSKDWGKGLDILKTLGFEEHKRTIGHRVFISLTYKL